jgi:hypothetical protein
MTWAISGDRLARSTVFSRLRLEDEYSEEEERKRHGVPCMRHADHSIDVPKRRLEQLVREDARSILEPEQAMICQHRADAKQMRMQDALECERGETRMPVDEGDVLAEHDRPQVRKKGEKVRERGRGRNGCERDVVHLQPGRKPAHADAVWRVAVGDHDDLCCAAGQIDSRQCMIAYAPYAHA